MIPEHGRERDRMDEAEEEEAPAASGGKLKTVLLAVAASASVLAVAGALAFTIMQGRATQSRLEAVSAELKAANESLATIRNELEGLKFIMTRQKALLDAERRQEEPAPAATHAVPQAGTTHQEKKTGTGTGTKAGTPPATSATSAKPAAKAADKKAPDQTLTTAPEKSGARQLQGIRDAIDKFNQK